MVEEINDLGIATGDKITYKNTLQFFINRCLASLHTNYLHRGVSALESALYFDIEGLSFKSEIDNFKKQLKVNTRDYVSNRISQCNNNLYYKPKTFDDLNFRDKSVIKNDAYFYYWSELLHFLLELVAKRDGLLKSKQYIEEGSES